MFTHRKLMKKQITKLELCGCHKIFLALNEPNAHGNGQCSKNAKKFVRFAQFVRIGCIY